MKQICLLVSSAIFLGACSTVKLHPSGNTVKIDPTNNKVKVEDVVTVKTNDVIKVEVTNPPPTHPQPTRTPIPNIIGKDYYGGFTAPKNGVVTFIAVPSGGTRYITLPGKSGFNCRIVGNEKVEFSMKAGEIIGFSESLYISFTYYE